jgi:hypothetical protein
MKSERLVCGSRQIVRPDPGRVILIDFEVGAATQENGVRAELASDGEA